MLLKWMLIINELHKISFKHITKTRWQTIQTNPEAYNSLHYRITIQLE